MIEDITAQTVISAAMLAVALGSLWYARKISRNPNPPQAPHVSATIEAVRSELPGFYRLTLTFRNTGPIDWSLMSVTIRSPDIATFGPWERYEEALQRDPVMGLEIGEGRIVEFGKTGLLVPAASMEAFGITRCELGTGEWIAASAAGVMRGSIILEARLRRLTGDRTERRIRIRIKGSEYQSWPLSPLERLSEFLRIS